MHTFREAIEELDKELGNGAIYVDDNFEEYNLTDLVNELSEDGPEVRVELDTFKERYWLSTLTDQGLQDLGYVENPTERDDH